MDINGGLYNEINNEKLEATVFLSHNSIQL